MRLRLRFASVVVRAVRRWLLLDLHVAGQELALSALLAPQCYLVFDAVQEQVAFPRWCVGIVGVVGEDADIAVFLLVCTHNLVWV